MKKSEYVVLDIETTGLSKYYHKITEIAAVKYRGKRKLGEFHSLVNPECHIPRFITKLTGIDDEMVEDAPIISEVMPKLVKFLGDRIIVAHSASFDYGFLDTNAKKHTGSQLLNEALCTRKLANRLLNELPSKKLGNLCEFFDITNSQAHRAMGDTVATAKIFHNFLDMLKEADITERQDVFGFERAPRGKFRKRA